MTPLAVLGADRRKERAARRAPNHRRRGPHVRALALSACPSASEALTKNDAKDSRRDSYALPSRILKPNIYYKAHNFAPEPIGSGLSWREPRRLFRPGTMATSSLREWTTYAGFFLDKPGARMVEDGSCEG